MVEYGVCIPGFWMPPPPTFAYEVDVEKGYMRHKMAGELVHRSSAAFKQPSTPVENQLAFSTVPFMEILGALHPKNPQYFGNTETTASYFVDCTLEEHKPGETPPM